jgi:hypothetical protein
VDPRLVYEQSLKGPFEVVGELVLSTAQPVEP